MNIKSNKISEFLWYFAKPYKGYMIMLLATGVVWGLQMSFSPYVLKLIIDKISYGVGEPSAIANELIPLAFVYICTWTIASANFRFTDLIKLKFFPAIRQDIIEGMFAYLSKHSFNYFQNNFAGSLANKINDMNAGAVSIISKLDEYFAHIISALIASVMMFYVHPLFAGILISWIFILFLVSLMFYKKVSILSKEFSESKTTVVGKIVDSISNILNIKAFAKNEFENKGVNIAVTDTVVKDRKMQKAILIMKICQDITFVCLIAAMLFGLIFMYKNSLVTTGDFVLILTISFAVAQGMWWLTNQLVQFAEDIGKCVQAISIVTKSHEVKDVPNAKSLQVEKGEISFKNVTFKYEGSDNIFQNKSITINPGEKIGLVGFSGGGKSTFVNLILRFFDIESGAIEIDGQNISEVTQRSLRSAITFIPQDTSLFHRTLLENIRYGNIDATDEEVTEASKSAYCDEFIRFLPMQYQSLVGERGIKLSGGQRQRIAIARAMLKNSPIIILDEATSALDSVTEEKIKKSLNQLMDNKTSIVIAHRLSTLAQMDKILVFDNGNIIESGTHGELLKLNGHYAKMWSMQAGGFLPEIDLDEVED
jgi:ATP-binding cassette, subfamily B, bacterial